MGIEQYVYYEPLLLILTSGPWRQHFSSDSRLVLVPAPVFMGSTSVNTSVSSSAELSGKREGEMGLG